MRLFLWPLRYKAGQISYHRMNNLKDSVLYAFSYATVGHAFFHILFRIVHSYMSHNNTPTKLSIKANHF
jgi:hypothetical protein